jgi:hypothetical protein
MTPVSEVTTLISSKRFQRLVQIGVAVVTGSVLELSCGGVAEKVVQNVNPCGTILECDPVEYDLLTQDYPDWDLDPTCTVPGQCGGYPVSSSTTTTN